MCLAVKENLTLDNDTKTLDRLSYARIRHWTLSQYLSCRCQPNVCQAETILDQFDQQLSAVAFAQFRSSVLSCGMHGSLTIVDGFLMIYKDP